MRAGFPFACSVCFGDPASLSSKALVAAVFFLLGVVVLVLGTIAFTAFKWSRRAKEVEKFSSL